MVLYQLRISGVDKAVGAEGNIGAGKTNRSREIVIANKNESLTSILLIMESDFRLYLNFF